MSSMSPRYELVRLLAQGGICDVYEAESRGADGYRRPVVVKRLQPRLAGDERWERRLRHEAELLLRVEHPLCVQVHNYIELQPGQGGIVLERVDGDSLEALEVRVRAGTPPPFDGAWLRARAAELARALDELQTLTAPRPFVHGDLHPGNLLVTRDLRRLRLVDFGQARLDEGEGEQPSGTTAVTPGFTAPEVANGAAPTIAADMYAVGRVLAIWADLLDDEKLAALGAHLAAPEAKARPPTWLEAGRLAGDAGAAPPAAATPPPPAGRGSGQSAPTASGRRYAAPLPAFAHARTRRTAVAALLIGAGGAALGLWRMAPRDPPSPPVETSAPYSLAFTLPFDAALPADAPLVLVPRGVARVVIDDVPRVPDALGRIALPPGEHRLTLLPADLEGAPPRAKPAHRTVRLQPGDTVDVRDLVRALRRKPKTR